VAEERQSTETDGRRLRSERSRQAIIDAALVLMEEGVLVATAQQIAARAGVGIRSFFRHFEDMEALARAIDEQIRDSYESLVLGGDRGGTLGERIEHAVERRADLYETVRNILLSAQAQRWRYEFLRRNHARNQRGLRKDLEDWLPELESLPRSGREAVDAVVSFEMWNRLREHQGLSRKASMEIVKGLLKSLIPESV
jgi:AcrR family transcriptional regulator